MRNLFRSLIQGNHQGQATIEFVLSFSFLLFFILFFITVGINLAIGYVAHYAVFKASRTFLTYDNGRARGEVLGDAIREGNNVFKTFSQLNLDGQFSILAPTDIEIYEYVGAKLLFKPKVQSIGPFALPEGYQFLSESFLGKEPTRSECRCQVQNALQQGCETEINNYEVMVFDNGC